MKLKVRVLIFRYARYIAHSQRYETLKNIASGSYGEVYLCRDKHDATGGTKVAVKVFLGANSHPQVRHRIPEYQQSNCRE